MIREMATGRELPEGADNVLGLWRGFIEDRAGGTLEGLEDVLADQNAFARFTRRMIEDLGFGDQLGDDPDDTGDDEDAGAEDDRKSSRRTRDPRQPRRR